MYGERLADLDELVLRCRGRQAKSYIAEAAACYRAGAYRSCVVATWIAVVYDFLDKLRELELAGDKKAKARLAGFQNAQQQDDKRSLLDFERHWLDVARDEFELLSSSEHGDLSRLQDDRNRCVHPSLNRDDEAFEASPELARCHLRTAVLALLQHPPVQGKAALNSILADVESPFFPESTDEAIRYFRHGPLQRPRQALVRNVIDALIKSLLREDLEGRVWKQRVAALHSVWQVHHEPVALFLEDKLGSIARGVSDAQLVRLTRLVDAVPDLWTYLDDALRGRVERYIESLPKDELAPGLAAASGVPRLKEMALRKMRSLSASELSELITVFPAQVLVKQATDFYAQSSSYSMANGLGGDLIEPLLPLMTRQDIERLLSVASRNGEITGSWRWQSILRRLQIRSDATELQLQETLTRYGLSAQEEDNIEDIPF